MLGEQIKRCREKRGFTQEQLAEKIGVSIETISSIERGIKMPRLQNFVAIANQLGVSADELLQDELDFGFIAEANALSKKLEELSRADRKRILETMNFLIVQAGGKSEKEFRFSVDKKNCIGLEKRQKQAGADGYLNRTE